MSENILCVKNIKKSFGGVHALKGVDLTIKKGETHCLAGENGCGKSTIIKVISGFYKPDEGTIEIDGKEYTNMSTADAIAAGIQVIYQDFSIFPNLTVMENLAFNQVLAEKKKFVNKREFRKIAEEAVKKINFDVDLDARVETLPVADKQLIAISRALLHNAKFNSLIVTLGTSSICSGILFGAFEAGRTELPDKLYKLSKINIATVTNAKSGLSSSLPVTFIIMIVLYVIAYLILNYTMAGRSVYAVGGDEVSAQRAGINVGKVRFLVFVVNGGIAAIAGLCYAMMSYFYLPNEYAGAEMLVIAAVILGGTRMTGGIGTLRGCLLGTLLLTMVANSLILLGISVYWEKVFIGAIIIIGTAISAMQAKSASKTTAKKKGVE